MNLGMLSLLCLRFLPGCLKFTRSFSNFRMNIKRSMGDGAGFTAYLDAMSIFCPDFFETGMPAATLADKILKGAPAGTIPVVTPENHLQLNYKVIKEPGLNVREALLSMAKEIIR